MGQYYKGIILKEGTNEPEIAFSSYSYESGAKLMEHSYIGNQFVRRMEKEISPEGNHYKAPVVWGGDYADSEIEGEDIPLYMLCDNVLEEKSKDVTTKKRLRYIVNHTKKLYVDKEKVSADKYGYKINPLPLLTAEGNGRGGGDYHGNNEKLVGSWARDIISTESAITSFKKSGYEEIIPNFNENI